MTNALTRLIQRRDWLLTDGATGTALFNMGLARGDPPELWNIDRPDDVRRLYRSAVEAGSDVFLTNTFGGNAARLRLFQSGARVKELNHVAATLARDVADACQRPVVVAGSVGPTGEIMEPVGTLKHATAVEIFHEQAEALKAGGVDVLWLETVSSAEEFTAAAEAFDRVDMPWCGTMSFDTGGRTIMGLKPDALAGLVDRLPNPPLAYGANCGVGASDLLRTILELSAQGRPRPIIAKGNAGIPKFQDGHLHYDGTPELMAEYAVLARDSGAQIIGGCCGTMPEHLEKMHAALSTRPRGPRPTLEQIVAKLGPFSGALADR